MTDLAWRVIQKGADVNARDQDGLTPLHVAASQTSGDMLDLLISRRADVNAVDKMGRTPLHWAAGCGGAAMSREDEVKLLAQKNQALQDKLLACERRVADLTAAGAQPKPAATAPADPFRAVAIRFSKDFQFVRAEKKKKST
jgi:ankyrin repeat protein